MDAVLAEAAIVCPECGAGSHANAKFCWLCGRVLPGSPFAPGAAPAPAQARAAWQFGLSTLLLFVTLAAVLLGVFVMSPGLGVLLAVLIAPPVVRTCTLAARAEARGRPLSDAEKGRAFARSLGVTAAVLGSVVAVAVVGVVVLGIALFLACFAALGGR